MNCQLCVEEVHAFGRHFTMLQEWSVDGKKIVCTAWRGAGKCGALRDVCKDGTVTEAVEAVSLLAQSECRIHQSLLHTVLKRCIANRDLVLGRHVHALAVQSGYGSDTILANRLIGMYASHGKLEEATQVFSQVSLPNAFVWASIILAHDRCGRPISAIKLYRRMTESKVRPDNHVYVAVLKACAKAGDLASGKNVHADILASSIKADVFVSNSLVNMYAKCGSLEDARKVFDGLPTRNVVVWTTMLAGYAHDGQGKEALEIYVRMQQEGMCPPDRVTFVCLLHACGSIGALHEGKQLHAQIREKGLETDVVVGNTLVSMYARCGSLADARTVFDRLPLRDVVTWNAMIAGYVHQGRGHEALGLYSLMQAEGIGAVSPVTFVCLLQACACVANFRQGQQLHAHIQERGMEANLVIGNSLVDMYAKCGRLEDARKVFDRLPMRDVVTWNALIGGYAQHGLVQEAIELYIGMHQGSTTLPDNVTFVSLLQACSSAGALHKGRQVHAQIKEKGLEADEVVGNALVSMYAKCGCMEDARRVFERLPTRDVVTWNTMIAGYVKDECCREALALSASMDLDGMVSANRVTFVCLLQACAAVGALQQGKKLHARIQQACLEADVAVGNSLVDMYVKCGSLEEARRVFDCLPTKDVVTWTAMLNGYAQNGDGQMAMQCFEQMLHQQSLEPDGTVFGCLLTACSHAGLVREGQHYFRQMVEDHGISPTGYHMNCIVDLLGRSGYIEEAEKLLGLMPANDCVVGWTSLLSACKSHGNIDCGRRCFDRLMELEPQSSVAYVLLANIYSNAGMWREAYEIERLRKCAGAHKKPAKACIEVKHKVHEFSVGEERSDIVSSKLTSTNLRLKGEGGHVPQTQLVLKRLSDQDKEGELCGHAEKLALAYGLLNTPQGSTLLVTKNLRMCNDCHSSTKILSALEKREIIVRDAHCVHRFIDGSCSCGDRH